MTPRTVRLGAALVLVSLVAACLQDPLHGNLALEITAPVGVEPSVAVTGPDFAEVVSASVEFTELMPGAYDIEPVAVETANTAYTGFEAFAAEATSVAVVAGQTTDATVEYAYRGFRIPDPDDDAEGVAGPQPIYDVVEFSSEVVGDDLVLSVVMRSDQSNLGDVRGIIEIDVDRDATTGEPPGMDIFCAPVALGVEAVITLDASVPVATVTTSTGTVDLDVTVAANVVTIVVPLATIDSPDGRVHAGLVIGNEAEPTDCVPGGAGNV